MEQIITNIENLTLHHLLPGTKIRLKDDVSTYVFIGYTNDNKYVLMNNMDKQIYNNTIICSSIENIIT